MISVDGKEITELYVNNKKIETVFCEGISIYEGTGFIKNGVLKHFTLSPEVISILTGHPEGKLKHFTIDPSLIKLDIIVGGDQ